MSNLIETFAFAVKSIVSSGVACFAISIHLSFKPMGNDRSTGCRNKRLNNRFFTITSNGEISIIDQSRLASDSFSGADRLHGKNEITERRAYTSSPSGQNITSGIRRFKVSAAILFFTKKFLAESD